MIHQQVLARGGPGGAQAQIHGLLAPLMESADQLYGDLASVTDAHELDQGPTTSGGGSAFTTADVFMGTDRAAAEAVLASHSGEVRVGLFLLRHKSKTATVLSMVTGASHGPPKFKHHILAVTDTG